MLMFSFPGCSAVFDKVVFESMLLFVVPLFVRRIGIHPVNLSFLAHYEFCFCFWASGVPHGAVLQSLSCNAACCSLRT